MHFKEESKFYLCSKFHPDRCKFTVIIRLSKFTPDFWSRLPNFTPGFYSLPGTTSIYITIFMEVYTFIPAATPISAA